MKNLQHNIDWLKRQATILKKEKGIKHHEALNLIAKQYGYTSWLDCLEKNSKK